MAELEHTALVGAHYFTDVHTTRRPWLTFKHRLRRFCSWSFFSYSEVEAALNSVDLRGVSWQSITLSSLDPDSAVAQLYDRCGKVTNCW